MNDDPALLISELKKPVESKADLLSGASAVSMRAPEQMRRTVELYCIARYLIVLYEATFGEITIQVWNEYRNSLDHYIRHVTDAGKGHLKSMEGHIQRAVLDICKMHCHRSSDLFLKRLNANDEKALALVDNGQFQRQIIAMHDDANKDFYKAKKIDLALGDDAQQNQEVLDAYLTATYAHFAALDLLRSKRKEIAQAYETLKSIESTAKNESAVEHIVLSLAAKAVWYIAVFVGGLIISKYFL